MFVTSQLMFTKPHAIKRHIVFGGICHKVAIKQKCKKWTIGCLIKMDLQELRLTTVSKFLRETTFLHIEKLP